MSCAAIAWKFHNVIARVRDVLYARLMTRFIFIHALYKYNREIVRVLDKTKDLSDSRLEDYAKKFHTGILTRDNMYTC